MRLHSNRAFLAVPAARTRGTGGWLRLEAVKVAGLLVHAAPEKPFPTCECIELSSRLFATIPTGRSGPNGTSLQTRRFSSILTSFCERSAAHRRNSLQTVRGIPVFSVQFWSRASREDYGGILFVLPSVFKQNYVRKWQCESNMFVW